MQNINPFSVYRSLYRVIPAEGLIVGFLSLDEETGEQYPGQTSYSRSAAVRELREQATWRQETDLERLSSIRSLADVESLFADSLSEQAVALRFLCTPGELEKKKAQEERKRLEPLAQQLAAEHGLRVDSFEFIRYLEAKIERERDYREGMREDGLCIGYGVTPDQWLGESNYSQSQEATYHDLLDFLSSYCPLLMAQYREQRLGEEPLAQEAPVDSFRSGMQILHKRAAKAGVLLGQQISSADFAKLGLPMIVSCQGCEMTMSFPSCYVAPDGSIYCGDCSSELGREEVFPL
jgi:hypothetical protein